MDLEQAEAALIGHYPRLARLAYLLLPPGSGRGRRVLQAHAIVQRSLPRGRGPAAGDDEDGAVLPSQRTGGERQRAADGPGADPGYAYVRLQVIKAALAAGGPRGPLGLPRPGQWPPLLPRVFGLRLFPRSGGSDELALDQALAALTPAARAAHVIRGLEGLSDADAHRLLAAAGVPDPGEALAEAEGLELPAGSRDEQLLLSAEFDPCSLQARPTDLVRRRQHTRAALAAAAALAACAALLGLPGVSGWGEPDDAAAPPYAQNAFAQQALDPAKLAQAGRDDWRRAARPDFAAWPARGDRTGDTALLGRALKVWARPSSSVRVSATPGTLPGPAAGAPQLLFAGDVDSAAVVLFHDGQRMVRYAEPIGSAGQGAALDFARTDGADAASATAVVVSRVDGNVRYLTAPWVSGVSSRDVLKPTGDAEAVQRTKDGVTPPVPSPVGQKQCARWEALELRTRPSAGAGAVPHLVSDLGELLPARLTYGNPSQSVANVSSATARQRWARSACRLGALAGQGVRSVNAWTFAGQPLPESGGTAAWLCARADTWRGRGTQVLALFQPPGRAQAAVAARGRDTIACGAREPRALAGVLWKSRSGKWYVLAAGSRDVASVTASGGVSGEARGRFLALRTERGARADLTARLADGSRLAGLGG
ncbi:hypothetical protein G5C51_41250 [Streptomyces sp. A7024]|uniref:DNA-directed RNA polymerase specialized sigma24 family protein n=1 Tax=Streptomyces coryli TaxID=1128680 RepID=A0A6G4UEW9_9ACTN|nr:hypothetical protein [Streptomyces coryli]